MSCLTAWNLSAVLELEYRLPLHLLAVVDQLRAYRGTMTAETIETSIAIHIVVFYPSLLSHETSDDGFGYLAFLYTYIPAASHSSFQSPHNTKWTRALDRSHAHSFVD
jgi:hypothetical protein